MNFHSDLYINNKIKEHYEEAKQIVPEDRIIGIFCNGSQNYGLDIESSDIDTKVITIPSFEEIVLNKKPLSISYERTNKEHIDFKDIRLYIDTFKKQNLNFIEILFTPYKIINKKYKKEFNKIIDIREDIARYDIYRAIKSILGVAYRQYKKIDIQTDENKHYFEKYEYDVKKIYHLKRIEEFIEKYINNLPYYSCLISDKSEYLKSLKQGYYSKTEALQKADLAIEHIDKIVNDFLDSNNNEINQKVNKILEETTGIIIKNYLMGEFNETMG